MRPPTLAVVVLVALAAGAPALPGDFEVQIPDPCIQHDAGRPCDASNDCKAPSPVVLPNVDYAGELVLVFDISVPNDREDNYAFEVLPGMVGVPFTVSLRTTNPATPDEALEHPHSFLVRTEVWSAPLQGDPPCGGLLASADEDLLDHATSLPFVPTLAGTHTLRFSVLSNPVLDGPVPMCDPQCLHVDYKFFVAG